MANELHTLAIAIGAILVTIFMAAWIIIPVKETIIPYSRKMKDEAVLISRVLIRTMLFIFFLRMAIVHIIIFVDGDHGTWVANSDAFLLIVTAILLTITIKNHPDGMRGL